MTFAVQKTRIPSIVDELVRDFDFRPNTPLKDGLSAFVDWFNTYHT